jgi:hypothetical protein
MVSLGMVASIVENGKGKIEIGDPRESRGKTGGYKESAAQDIRRRIVG